MVERSETATAQDCLRAYRKIQRAGIRLFGSLYYAPEFPEPGHEVLVRYDPQDLRAVYVYDVKDGRLICVAPEVPAVPAREMKDEGGPAARSETARQTNNQALILSTGDMLPPLSEAGPSTIELIRVLAGLREMAGQISPAGYEHLRGLIRIQEGAILAVHSMESLAQIGPEAA
jgi:hypothetical protein